MDDKLLEPLKAYKESYASEILKNASTMFDDLVKKSGVDVAQNRATTKAYRTECALSQKAEDQLSSLRGWRGFLIFLTVAGLICVAIGIYLLVVVRPASGNNVIAGSVLIPVGAVLAIAMLALIFALLNPKIKNMSAIKQSHDQKAAELLKKAWEQMRPLNALFDDNMTKRLIEMTVPLIKIDDNFNMRRYDYLSGKYGFGSNDNTERSTIGILTGEILGNPFVVDRQIIQSMGHETYFGSMVITWTTTYVDSDGHVHSQLHTQTLTASVTKPKPQYQDQTRLIYGNEAAPDLHFSHAPSHAEDMSENALERKVKSGSKKIRRKQAKQMRKGTGNFTEMGNEEFDVLFGALDRDNEVQFRLLFTPLAQKNMLELMKDQTGFGDDFYMRKSGCLNYVSSEHSASWDMDTAPSKYRSFDVDISLKKFREFNSTYFKSLFFDLAPLMSIPLYQQHKPHEYIYRDSYARNYTDYEAEYAVNALGQDVFKHPASATQAILKTKLIEKDGRSDHIAVTAYSFRAEDRVEFVPRLGGDGLMHSVPVHWLEYLPIQNVCTVKLKELGMSEREYVNRLGNNDFAQIMKKYAHRVFGHGLLCCLVDATDKSFDKDIDGAIK